MLISRPSCLEAQYLKARTGPDGFSGNRRFAEHQQCQTTEFSRLAVSVAAFRLFCAWVSCTFHTPQHRIEINQNCGKFESSRTFCQVVVS